MDEQYSEVVSWYMWRCNPRVASDPAQVSHAAELIIWVNIEDIFHGHGRAEEETSDGMHDTLRLAGRTGSLQQLESASLCITLGRKLT